MGTPSHSNSVKTEEPTATTPKSTKTVTGRAILVEYKKGDPVALVSYKKICNALNIMEKWENATKVQFLEQFMDISDLLDDKCMTLVQCLTNLQWHIVPLEMVNKFQNLLCDVAVRQICHTESVYSSAVRNLMPKMKTDEESGEMSPLFDEVEQERLYTMAHQIIAHVLSCFPMSAKLLIKVIKQNFPHYTMNSSIFVAYIRNIILISEYANKISSQLWNDVIEHVVLVDVLLTKVDVEADSCLSGLFAMDTKMEQDDVIQSFGNDEKLKKLDGSMSDILTYLTVKHDVPLDSSISSKWLKTNDKVTTEMVFSTFLTILDEKMLMSVHARFTSFIWLYLASLDTSYTTRIMDFLWNIVTRPQRAQSDAKKAQGASAYLAAFLARAKFIKIESAYMWLCRMYEHCQHYVNNTSGTYVAVGAIRHGTFYALCQAFFIVFSFRYKELVRTGDIEDLRRKGIGRVVHSPLEPLKYVSRPVAVCFATITRSLQLVYCSHVLALGDEKIAQPFEEMFPFDSYLLEQTRCLINPLMRKFSPLAEDVNNLSTALESEKTTVSEDSGMDFLDMEDDSMLIGSYREKSSICAVQNNMFSIYSSSPGLRSYDNTFTR